MATRYKTKVTLPDHPRQLPVWIYTVLESGRDVRITSRDGYVICQSEPRQQEEDEEATG